MLFKCTFIQDRAINILDDLHIALHERIWQYEQWVVKNRIIQQMYYTFRKRKSGPFDHEDQRLVACV